MKRYLILCFGVVSAHQKSDLRAFLQEALEKKQNSSTNFAENSDFILAYETLQALDKVNEHLAHVRTQTEVMAQASTLVLEQHRKSQVPYSTRLYNACASCVQSVRKTYPVQMLEESPELQAICGAIVFFAALNCRLLYLQSGYYAAQDQAHKQQCKKSYQALVHGIQAVIGIEKMITVRVRDACIGFWGNGQFVKKFFGAVCDWCSLRSLFYIDERMLE